MDIVRYSVETNKPVGLSFTAVKEIVDTSGFEPLEVKIKRMLLAGQVATIRANLYDSYEIKEMYDSIPDVVDDQYDDLEEVNWKIARINEIRAEIYARKFGANASNKSAGESKEVTEGKNISPIKKSSQMDDIEGSKASDKLHAD